MIGTKIDISGQRTFPEYLYSASELIDRAADLASEPATLVHDNERRWRVFQSRVEQVNEGIATGHTAEASGPQG